MRRQARVDHLLHRRVLFQPLRQRQRVGAVLGHAQRQRLGAHRDPVRGLGGQRAAHVAQALLLDLRQPPTGGRALAVRVIDVGVVGPVVQAGVGHRAAQRVAMAADVLRQGIHDQRRTHRSSRGRSRR
ncbi:hypothetical protein G6F60_014695 [Rhizopus arrhizus]|nr:hypothetical protein G6F60_014695 [Rhizopus arrhizus]